MRSIVEVSIENLGGREAVAIIIMNGKAAIYTNEAADYRLAAKAR
jgi:hypothetical protein